MPEVSVKALLLLNLVFNCGSPVKIKPWILSFAGQIWQVHFMFSYLRLQFKQINNRMHVHPLWRSKAPKSEKLGFSLHLILKYKSLRSVDDIQTSSKHWKAGLAVTSTGPSSWCNRGATAQIAGSTSRLRDSLFSPSLIAVIPIQPGPMGAKMNDQISKCLSAAFPSQNGDCY